jgi:periodic tryptophan protein 1
LVSLLLTAAYDKTASIVDVRSPNQVYKWKLTADVEQVQWDNHRPQEFLVSSEDGMIQCFDSLAPSQTHFSLQAHSSSVTGLSLNPAVPGCLATVSDDKSLKIWDISDHKPSLIYSNDSMMVRWILF